MTREELNTFLLALFEENNVIGFHDSHLKDDFLCGTNPLDFRNLAMDSLAVMEICIAVELELGVSVVPDQLVGMASLAELVNHIEGSSRWP